MTSLYRLQRDPISARHLNLEEINPSLHLLAVHFAAEINNQWDQNCTLDAGRKGRYPHALTVLQFITAGF